MNKPIPRLQLTQHHSPGYAPRTAVNAFSGALTVAFAEDFHTAGERLTKKMAGHLYVDLPLSLAPINAARRLYKAMRYHGVASLNVAGNGIYTLQQNWTQESVNRHVYEVLSTVNRHLPIESVRSGGQTGADMAGLVAAYAIGVPLVIGLFPRGFIQRGTDKIDREHSVDEIREQIMLAASALTELLRG